MKCLKNDKNEVKRVSEEHALELLGKGWKFCPKSEWKKDRKPVVVASVPVPDEVIDPLKPRKVPGKKNAYREELKRKRRSQL